MELQHQEVLDDGAQADGREEGQGPHDEDRADQEQREGHPGDREAAGAYGDGLLGGQAPGQGQDRHDEQEAADSMASPRVRLYQGVLADRPAKALPLLPIQEVKA